MKELIYPLRTFVKTGPREQLVRSMEEEPVNSIELAKRLRKTTLFSHIEPDQLVQLLEQSPEHQVRTGVELVMPGQQLQDHLIILDGSVEARRAWSIAEGVEKSYAWELSVEAGGPGIALLTASAGNISVRAISDTQYVALSGDAVDDLLGWSELYRRLPQARNLKIFHHLPLENVALALERMAEREVETGETIVTQGEPGDAYYVILSGEAEVWQTDPFTDEVFSAGVRRDGDAFGEEALLQNAYRNATVKMTTPGRLLVLAKADFDELLKPIMVHEVDAKTAHRQFEEDSVRLLDCRYDMEFDESRIPVDVALIQVTPPDDYGYVSLGVSVDVVAAAVECASLVIAEVNAAMPWTMGDSTIHLDRMQHLVEIEPAVIEYVHQPTEHEVVGRIARYIAGAIDDGLACWPQTRRSKACALIPWRTSVECG